MPVSRPVPKEDPWTRTAVVAGDLDLLGRLQDLLYVLNDPLASATKLGMFVDQVPVLAARLHARLNRGRPRRRAWELLALHGNRALEQILLELLEDLAVLNADLEDLAA